MPIPLCFSKILLCFPENFPFMQKLRIQFLGFLHHGHFEELKVMPSEARLKNFETWILNFTTVKDVHLSTELVTLKFP